MSNDVNREYFVDYVCSRTRGRPSLRVLDYGCGRGATVRALRARAVDAYGADVFFAGMDYEDIGSDELVVQGIIRRISPRGDVPFPDQWFDVLISDQVLEHVKDLDKAISEFGRLIKSGGVMLHHFPSLEVWREPHYNVWFSHRVHPRMRRPYLRISHEIGLGGNEPGFDEPAAWAAHVDSWLRDFCQYRRRSQLISMFAGTSRDAEIDYCRYRAHRTGHPIVLRLLAFRPLGPVYRWLFRRLAFSAIEVTAPALQDRASGVVQAPD